MRKPALAFVAVVLVAAVVCGYLAAQLRTEQAAVLQLQERVSQLEKALPASQLALRLTGPAPPLPAAATGAGPAAALPAQAAPPPKILALFSNEIRTALGLTAEEAGQFRQLLRDNRPAADFVALIGHARYEQYQDLLRTARRELQVEGLRTSLASTLYPLTPVQETQLDSLLAKEQRQRAAEDSARTRPTEPRAQLAYDEATLKATQAANERVLDGARSFLGAEQIVIVRNQLASTVDAQLDGLKSRRAQLDAGGR